MSIVRELINHRDAWARGSRAAVVARLADSVACTIAAEQLADREDIALARARTLCSPVEGGAATIWATGERAITERAAFRNGVALRFLDLNDTFIGRSIVHPSDLIPGLVALAEELAEPWERLMGAIAIAYECLCQIADQVDLGAQGFEAATLSPIASALAGSWLVGLGRERSEHAVALAALDAGTLAVTRRGKLSHWKAMSSARGVVKGLEAIRAATAGVEAPKDVFESPFGFVANVSGPIEVRSLDGSYIHRTLLKRYPVQIFIQAPLALAAALREEIDVSEIQRVQLRVPERVAFFTGGQSGYVANRETADHDLRFCMAAMLKYGRFEIDDLGLFLEDRNVGEIANLIELETDNCFTALYPRSVKYELRVFLSTGECVQRRTTAHDVLHNAGQLTAKIDSLLVDPTLRRWPFVLPGSPPEFPLRSRATKGLSGEVS